MYEAVGHDGQAKSWVELVELGEVMGVLEFKCLHDFNIDMFGLLGKQV